MREILFRGKRLDNGEWVYGDLSQPQYNHPEKSLIYDETAWDNEVDPSTVGQYTGLKDKIGKRIFEGDIVRFTSDPIRYSECGTVVFRKGCYEIEYLPEYSNVPYYHRIGKVGTWREMNASGTITYEYEVIGNIHDNPELLEGGQDNE